VIRESAGGGTSCIFPFYCLRRLTVIHIPQQLADDLQAWRLECEAKAREAFSKGKRKSASVLPDDFMFENEEGGFLDTDNYRKRVLHKIARELRLPKLTFQVIRRTIATLAQKKGTIKDVQGVMRHSRTATTTDVYMQEIPASVQSTINSINLELRKSDERNRRKPQNTVRAGTAGINRRKPFSRVTPNDTKSLRGGSAQLPAYA
jgi:integrase